MNQTAANHTFEAWYLAEMIRSAELLPWTISPMPPKDSWNLWEWYLNQMKADTMLAERAISDAPAALLFEQPTSSFFELSPIQKLTPMQQFFAKPSSQPLTVVALYLFSLCYLLLFFNFWKIPDMFDGKRVLCAFAVCMVYICIPVYFSDVPMAHPKLLQGVNVLAMTYIVF